MSKQAPSKKLSLRPLSLEQALEAALQVDPQEPRPGRLKKGTPPAKCTDCMRGPPHSGLVKGDVRTVGKRSWTKYIEYQCEACGTAWREVEDGGAGGHDSRWELIQPNAN